LLTHLKSLTLGRTIFVSFSKKLYILSHLIVTVRPTGIHALSLKFEIAFLAYFTTGACPEIKAKCSLREEKSLFQALTYVQIHIFRTIFSIFGISITLLHFNFSFKDGAISLLYFSLSCILKLNYY